MFTKQSVYLFENESLQISDRFLIVTATTFLHFLKKIFDALVLCNVIHCLYLIHYLRATIASMIVMKSYMSRNEKCKVGCSMNILGTISLSHHSKHNMRDIFELFVS